MASVALIQTAPVFLNKAATIQKAVEKIGAAAKEGAQLVVFTEAFIPGYPAWVWRLRPGGDWDLSETLHRRLLESAVDLSTDDLLPLCEAAKRHRVTVVCGIEERESDFGRTTLYNSVVIIGPDGERLNRHRKLMPTNPERMVWGFGDASGLRVVDTPAGRVGALLCWENYMPLARYAMYAQGVELYVAPTYDSGDDWLGTLRHIAREGGCWVLGCGNLMRASDIPEDLPGREVLYPDLEEWINPGDSVVIAPGGEVLAGPLHAEDGMLVCDIDLSRAATAKRALDVTGHYARPDIFQLRVNSAAQSPVVLGDE
ncbi:MAG: carbon-nitrogen hydrolase family protein [Thiotrichales bacterium]